MYFGHLKIGNIVIQARKGALFEVTLGTQETGLVHSRQQETNSRKTRLSETLLIRIDIRYFAPAWHQTLNIADRMLTVYLKIQM